MQSGRPHPAQHKQGKVLSTLLEPVVLLIAAVTLFVWFVLISLLLAWSVDQVVERSEFLIAAGLLSLLVMMLLITAYFDYKAKNQRTSLLWKALHGMFHLADNERAKSIILGSVLLMAVGLVFSAILVTWRLLPEVLADWIGTMVGIMTTPFFLEASFIFIGLTIVVAINHWRQKRDGDDFVEIEVKDSEE